MENIDYLFRINLRRGIFFSWIHTCNTHLIVRKVYIGWLKELRTLCDLVKSLPNELKAIPKDGVDSGVPRVNKY